MPTFSRRSLLAFALVATAALLLTGERAAGSTGGGERKRPIGVSLRPTPPTLGERAARIALAAVGTPYRYGGESPSSGFDCSGLVRWSYGRLGIDLPHSSYALASRGRAVAPSALAPGDVLLFAGLGHVGVYLGKGRMVHAPQSGRVVEVARLGAAGYRGRLVGARRVVA